MALGDNTARALARNTLELVLSEADRTGRVEPRRIPDEAMRVLDRALIALLDMENPHGLVPHLSETMKYAVMKSERNT